MKISQLLVLLALLTFPATALAGERDRIISVKGTSENTVKADYAKIHGQLKIVSKSIEDSYNQVTSKLITLAKNLQEFGITKDELVVSVISQGPEYQWRNNSRELTGYYSACSLSVKVNSIADTYKIHKTLSRDTSLAVGHTEYGRTDASQLENVALQEALKAARTKAEMMAETLGAKLGQPVLIREAGIPAIIHQPGALRLAESSADASSVTTVGNVTIRGDVIVEFEMQ